MAAAVWTTSSTVVAYTTRLLLGRVFFCPAPRRTVDEVTFGRCQEGRYMVISQSVVGNRKPKLFSQLNELYGNARTVPRASVNNTHLSLSANVNR
jgi:hypothetical protein